MTDTQEEDRGGVQAIARAAAVLRAIGRATKPLSLGEIAAAVDLPRSTVQRLVQALQHERLLEAGSADRPGVRLGPALTELASSIRIDVVRLARPHLQALFEAVNETVDLSQTNGREVRFLDLIVSSRELRVVPNSDVRQPLHCMANGKAMLAGMSIPAVERLLGATLDRPTARSIGTLAELLDELAEVRRSGFAYDRQEHSEGVCAVGVGIAPLTGRMHAVSVAIPAQRFEQALPTVRSSLLVCKDAIEQSLRAALQS